MVNFNCELWGIVVLTSTKIKLLLCMCVGYFWLYFSLSPQMVCMSGRAQPLAFLSMKKKINNFFFFQCRNERKHLFYQFGVMRTNNMTGKKFLKNCDFFLHQRGKAITESEHRRSTLGTLEGLSPFDSTLQYLCRNVEILLNRLLFICKNTWRKWGWEDCDSTAVLRSSFCKSFRIRKVRCDSFSVPLSPNIYGAIQLIFYSITFRRPNPSEVVSGIYYLWQHPWYIVAISSVQE